MSDTEATRSGSTAWREDPRMDKPVRRGRLSRRHPVKRDDKHKVDLEEMCVRCGHDRGDHQPNWMISPAPEPCAIWIGPTSSTPGHACECDNFVSWKDA